MRWKGYSGGAAGLRETMLVALARAQGSHSVVDGAEEGSRTSTVGGRCLMTSGPGWPRRLCHWRPVPEAFGGSTERLTANAEAAGSLYSSTNCLCARARVQKGVSSEVRMSRFLASR